MSYKKVVISDEQLSYLVTNFSETKNSDLCQKCGISESTLHRIAREHGLKKTADFMKLCQANTTEMARKANKMNNYPPKGYIIPKSELYRYKAGTTPVMRLGEERNKLRIQKSAEARKLTVKAEKRRVLFGLDQKTKLKVVSQSKQKLSFKHTLKLRGYIVNRCSDKVYYNEMTNRSEKSESTAKKYGFILIQLNNE